MAAVRYLRFSKVRFLKLGRAQGTHTHHYVKFRENRSNSCRDIVIWRFYKMAAAAILNFWKFKFLTVISLGSPILQNPAKFHRDRSISCWDMAIFQGGGRPPSWILKSANFKARKSPGCPYASSYQISSKSVKWLRTYHTLKRFFKMAAAAIMNFWKFKCLTASSLRRAFCIILPNFIEVGQSFAEIWRFFDFSRWRPSAILYFEKCEF